MNDSMHSDSANHDPDGPLTDRCCDGIRERDRPIPAWWKWTFLLTMMIAPPYLLYYHGGAEGRTMEDRYEAALASNLQLQFAEIGELKADRDTLLKFLARPNWLQVGKSVFSRHCAQCHGKDGGGQVGPNLTDDAYKNVSDVGDIVTVLQRGAGNGAMPAWQDRLSINELVLTAAYAASLRGTTPATAKPPEGRVIAPWPEPEPELLEEAVEELDDEIEPAS